MANCLESWLFGLLGDELSHPLPSKDVETELERAVRDKEGREVEEQERKNQLKLFGE